jgi:hypothetical protein
MEGPAEQHPAERPQPPGENEQDEAGRLRVELEKLREVLARYEHAEGREKKLIAQAVVSLVDEREAQLDRLLDRGEDPSVQPQ